MVDQQKIRFLSSQKTPFLYTKRLFIEWKVDVMSAVFYDTLNVFNNIIGLNGFKYFSA